MAGNQLADRKPGPDAVAIVGVACRFGDTEGPAEFWRAIVDQRALVARSLEHSPPGWINAGGVLRDGLSFDPEPFGISPMEALLMEPQHRVFLEACWHALEESGFASESFDGDIAIFGGIGFNSYEPLLRNSDLGWPVDRRMLGYGNDKDFAISRVAFKLGLTGPSVAVQTACSTSLTAVHLACQSLIDYECDLALAGGASVDIGRANGYLYEAGGILSSDGCCRPFDEAASGIVPSDGVAVVVLRRFEEAVRDGDDILAVILGSAVRNDGASKAGFSAPSVSGQVAAIRSALDAAGVDPLTITLIEAHGTATALGDPIEAAALGEVYQGGQEPCVLSGVKGILGHTDTASGAAGLIAVALALRNRYQPAINHFRRLNPSIDLTGSRIEVLDRGRPWASVSPPRRAAVNSLGLGGTNVHVILQEAPSRPEREHSSDGMHVVPISAATPSALRSLMSRTREFSDSVDSAHLADLAFTLQTGRSSLRYRAAILARDLPELCRKIDQGAYITGQAGDQVSSAGLVMMFPGGGAQRAGMAAELYRDVPLFRQCLSELVVAIRDHFAGPVQDWLANGLSADCAVRWIESPSFALPALFLVELSIAQALEALGLTADALLGHSLGEYVAATLAGVFSVSDAYRVVCERGRILASLDPGAMLSVALPEASARDYADPAGLDIAALNGASNTVLTGPAESVTRLAEILADEGISARLLPLAAAAHSRALDPFIGEFSEFLRTVKMTEPRRPFVSNVTGTWADPAEVTRPEYWSAQVRNPVRFADGLTTVARSSGRFTALEVGPGRALASIARRELGQAVDALPLLESAGDPVAEPDAFLTALAAMWTSGRRLRWAALHGGDRPHRTPAPVYPFQRRPFVPEARGRPIEVRLPTWRPASASEVPAAAALGPWIVVCDSGAVGLVTLLAEAGYEVRTCTVAELGAVLGSAVGGPVTVMDLSALGMPVESGSVKERYDRALSHCAALGSAIANSPVVGRLVVLTRRASRVLPDDIPDPALAPYCSVAATIPAETDTCSTLLDLDSIDVGDEAVLSWVRGGQGTPATAAFRLDRWWLPAEQAAGSPPQADGTAGNAPITAVVTGGLGGVGALLAEHLAEGGARLLLVSRKGDRSPAASDVLARIRAAGGAASVLELDVAAPGAANSILQAAVNRYGRVDIVVHAAALPVGAMLGVRQRGSADALHAVKVDATLALAEAMRTLAGVSDNALLVLTSSRRVARGSAGAFDYLAANLFLEAFAAARRTAEPRRLAVAWDRWQGVGMAKGLEERHFERTGERLVGGMDPVAAAAAFSPCLALASAGESLVTVAALPAAEPSSFIAVIGTPAVTGDEVAMMGQVGSESQLRDDEPTGELERIVAQVWAEALRLNRVGRDDNFFQLGGDSLLGLQVSRRLRDLLGRGVLVSTLFASPTPRRLAEAIAAVPDGEIVVELAPAARMSRNDIIRRRGEEANVEQEEG